MLLLRSGFIGKISCLFLWDGNVVLTVVAPVIPRRRVIRSFLRGENEKSAFDIYVVVMRLEMFLFYIMQQVNHNTKRVKQFDLSKDRRFPSSLPVITLSKKPDRVFQSNADTIR